MQKKNGLGVKIFTIIFGIAALVMGIKLLLVNTSSLTAISAEIVSISKNYADDTDTSSFDISYTYQVNGIDYQSNFSSSTEYSQGEMITVYYDPKSPETAYSSPTESKFLGVVGVILGLVCVGGTGWGMIKSRFGR
jgi:hypothetical protein